MNEPASDPVTTQYERWSYPEPLLDLSAEPFGSPDSHFKDLKDLYWAYWPSEPYREDLDILVAGCGTNAAASYAFLYPRARVVGIDISAPSLAHEDYLKKRHTLENLTLRQCRVEEVATLGKDFDFIAAQGMLHHLADPVAGMKSLGQVLRPEGVIEVMLYGRHGRVGVYMLQELFRILGVEQTADGVEVVKNALSALSPIHPLKRFLGLANDLHSASGLVDTFLHRRDRPYTVTECLDLVEQGGLTFQGWDENGFYYPDGSIPPNHPFHASIKKLHGPALWQAMELFNGCIYLHWFYVCRPERDPVRYRIHFDGDAFLDYVPVPRVTQRISPNPSRGQPAAIARPPFPQIPLDQWQAALFAQIDNQRTVRQCIQQAGLGGVAEAVEFARKFFGALWRVSYMLFRIPSAK